MKNLLRLAIAMPVAFLLLAVVGVVAFLAGLAECKKKKALGAAYEGPLED